MNSSQAQTGAQYRPQLTNVLSPDHHRVPFLRLFDFPDCYSAHLDHSHSMTLHTYGKQPRYPHIHYGQG
jgi:hypothetical protein